MIPKNLRSTVDVVKDLIALKRDDFEVEVPVKLLAELLYYGPASGAPAEATESCAFALSRALIDDKAVATPYAHALKPILEAVLVRARGEHILSNIGTPEAGAYPRDTAG
jgi:hypothetical protein